MRSQYCNAFDVQKSWCHASLKQLVALIFGFSVGTFFRSEKDLNLTFDLLSKHNSITRELYTEYSPDLLACRRLSNNSLPEHLFEISNLLRCHKATEDTATDLQSAYIKLHALLFKEGLLPLGSPKHGVPAVKNKWGQSRPTLPAKEDWDTRIPSRAGVLKHIAEHSSMVAANSTCLDWDNRQHVSTIDHCTSSWIYEYEDRVQPFVDLNDHALKANMNILWNQTEMLPKFDLALVNQVFEHVELPFTAAENLFNIMNPGGLIFWTAPFLEVLHMVPGDFFRYTCDGAQAVFRHVGFNIKSVQRIGNTQITTGWLLGFSYSDFPEDVIETNLLSNSHDKQSAINWEPGEWAFISCALVIERPR